MKEVKYCLIRGFYKIFRRKKIFKLQLFNYCWENEGLRIGDKTIDGCIYLGKNYFKKRK